MLPLPDDRLTYLGRTNFRQSRRLFGIRRADRRQHLYLVGKTGVGKSSLLEMMVRQDAANGEGAIVLDPHGDLVERLRARIPPARAAETVFLDLADPGLAWGFNPLHGVAPRERLRAVSGLVDAFRKTWADSWGPRLEHLLRHALLTLVEEPSATLADVARVFDEPRFRDSLLERVTNPAVLAFWTKEWPSYPATFRSEALSPLRNKVGAFLADPLVRRFLSEPRRRLDLRAAMDAGQIVLVNLARGQLGEGTASLLGALLTASIATAGLARASVPEALRRDCFVYLDEFQTYATPTLITMLSELRKYRVGLTLANQYLAQLEPEVQAAILGSVGTLVAFRVGPADAEILEGHFAPEIGEQDLLNLPNHAFYVRLLVDGAAARPFSGETLEP